MSQVTQVYGGDEINAVVLDPGSAWTRVGWSAEDGPSFTVSSSYADRDGEARYGDDQTYLVRDNVEIRNPMTDGVVSDWEHAAGLWKTSLAQCSPERTTEYLKESPLFITEQIWNTKEDQKKTMELALEDLSTPATYISKSPVLSLFSTGRGTGIVVDVGAQTASAAAVVDGFVLYKSAQRSLKAGDHLSKICRSFLGSDITPPYEVQAKEPVPLGEPAKFTKRSDLPPNITTSFREHQIDQVVNQFKESMVVVPDAAHTAVAPKPRVFEFPDGHSIQLLQERFDLGEGLFGNNSAVPMTDDDTNGGKSNSKAAENDDDVSQLNPWSEKGITDLVVDCLRGCDVDARANLANNIVVVGGTTLTQGFTERINQDLQKIFPMLKIRIFASGNLVERKNSAWIGGSILASLGTFHQLWVTKQEYEEVGSDQLAFKRFK